MVQNRRYCISPNGGFLAQIKEYEAIYRASNAVASHPPVARSMTRRKREDEDDDEEDLRMDDRKRRNQDGEEEPDEDAMQL